FRTGEAIEIAFTLRNISADTIATPSVTANNPITDSAASVVCMTSQYSLAPEETLDGICLFTPEAGLESYLDPDRLQPVITLTAAGTMISTDASAMADAEATLSLVDLALDVALTVMPNSAERGDDVRVEVTLTNSGASPIGCETQC